MLPEKFGKGLGMKFGKSATRRIFSVLPVLSDRTTVSPLANACSSAVVSMKPVVVFSVFALN
jgi:hypothetical protein